MSSLRELVIVNQMPKALRWPDVHGGKNRCVALVVLLFGGHPMAAGALAIDSLQGEKCGFSYKHPNADQAEQGVMRERGSNCSVVLRFSRECGAKVQ